jgi:hypothetical protein
MTASELIEELKKYPPEMPVYCKNEDYNRCFRIDREDVKIETLSLGWGENPEDVTGIMI